MKHNIVFIKNKCGANYTAFSYFCKVRVVTDIIKYERQRLLKSRDDRPKTETKRLCKYNIDLSN